MGGINRKGINPRRWRSEEEKAADETFGADEKIDGVLEAAVLVRKAGERRLAFITETTGGLCPEAQRLLHLLAEVADERGVMPEKTFFFHSVNAITAAIASGNHRVETDGLHLSRN